MQEGSVLRSHQNVFSPLKPVTWVADERLTSLMLSLLNTFLSLFAGHIVNTIFWVLSKILSQFYWLIGDSIWGVEDDDEGCVQSQLAFLSFLPFSFWTARIHYDSLKRKKAEGKGKAKQHNVAQNPGLDSRVGWCQGLSISGNAEKKNTLIPGSSLRVLALVQEPVHAKTVIK